MCTHARWSGADWTRKQVRFFQRRLTPGRDEIRDWIRSLPAPAVVVYEAGPSGFGLARYLIDADIDCLVAAPSKLQRPREIGSRPTRVMPGIWHGCCIWVSVAVAIPIVGEEAARDLVRDARIAAVT